MNRIKIGHYALDAPIEKILYDVRDCLDNGKLKTIQKTSSGWKVPCPSHSNGLESNPSCFINDDGVWHCFACGDKGYIDKFISCCFESSNSYAKEWLIKRYGKLVESIDIELDDINIQKRKIEAPRAISESILSTMSSYHPYMEKRKLSIDICKRFKVKYDSRTQCIVFPVWDENNRLVMLTRRSILNKNFIIDKNAEKPVYLLNYIINDGIKDVIVCESQINCLYCWSLGFPAIALFGTGTAHQYDILNHCNIKRYRLCLDGDIAGDKGRERFRSNIRNDVFIDDIDIPRGKDINDLTREDATRILSYR